MNIEKTLSVDAVLKELGSRISARRTELKLTQKEFALKAGIGKRTLEMVESGHDTKMSTLIKILKRLGYQEHLNLLIPEITESPMKMLQKKRKRGSKKTSNGVLKTWTWEDDK
ncbi:MAG: helix-turn-helix domain-containing protein [Planctomycetota bacterium]|jgi:transcriptional regulator with XRE-family HTH domain